MEWRPQVAREQRGSHWAIIDYVIPQRAKERPQERPARSVPPSARPPGSGASASKSPRRRTGWIGMVVPSWDRPCGVGEYTRSLVQGMGQLGQRVSVLSGRVRDLPAQVAEQGLGLVHFQYEYSLFDPSDVRPALPALQRLGVRMVATLHSFLDVPEHNHLIKDAFQRIIVHSDRLAAELERWGVPGHRLRVEPMGIRLHPLPDRRAVRGELGLGEETAIGFFGFVYPQKGIEPLAFALSELRRTNPGLRGFFFINVAPNATSRATYEHLQQVFDEHHLREVITVRTEYLPEAEVVKYLHAMDLNILPYQDFPARQISAAVRTVMAAQRPIITSDTFPFSDLGSEVYKVADASAPGIVQGVREVLGNPGLQASLMEQMRHYAERNDWVKVAARHQALYNTL